MKKKMNISKFLTVHLDYLTCSLVKEYAEKNIFENSKIKWKITDDDCNNDILLYKDGIIPYSCDFYTNNFNGYALKYITENKTEEFLFFKDNTIDDICLYKGELGFIGQNIVGNKKFVFGVIDEDKKVKLKVESDNFILNLVNYRGTWMFIMYFEEDMEEIYKHMYYCEETGEIKETSFINFSGAESQYVDGDDLYIVGSGKIYSVTDKEIYKINDSCIDVFKFGGKLYCKSIRKYVYVKESKEFGDFKLCEMKNLSKITEKYAAVCKGGYISIIDTKLNEISRIVDELPYVQICYNENSKLITVIYRNCNNDNSHIKTHTIGDKTLK